MGKGGKSFLVSPQFFCLNNQVWIYFQCLNTGPLLKTECIVFQNVTQCKYPFKDNDKSNQFCVSLF